MGWRRCFCSPHQGYRLLRGGGETAGCGGRQALLAEEAGSRHRRHRRCRCTSRLAADDAFVVHQHAAFHRDGLSRRAWRSCWWMTPEWKETNGSWSPAATPHIWAPAERLRDIHLQNLTTWMQHRRLHYLQFWAPLAMKVLWTCCPETTSYPGNFGWSFFSTLGLQGFVFIFFNPSSNFQCICVLWRQMCSILQGKNHISHTLLQVAITDTKVKFAQRPGAEKHN